jgi:predicted phage terminase large subunit-like protein
MKLEQIFDAQFELDLEAELIDKARKDILAFTLYTKEDYEINWHHKEIAKKLNAFAQGEIQYLMVFMPPRHGKSELVSRRLPAFLHGLYPDDEIMAVSYLDSLAGDMTVDVQKIIDSPEYQKLFPQTKIYPSRTSYTLGTRNSSEHHIVGRKGKYRGQGVGGSFTGKGANFIIIDDPIKGREIADSEAFRERLWNFYNNDLFSRLETNLQTGRKGQVLITQTRWHEDDLSGRLIELMKKDQSSVQWEIVNYPAIRVDMDTPTDPREIGEALWPEKYSVQQLDQIKSSIGPRAWGSLYQQSPTPDGGNIFKSEMFEFLSMPDRFDWSFCMADTSYKEKQENDFTVFSIFGVIKDTLYVRDVWMKQIKAVDVEKPVEAFLRKYTTEYGYRGTYIEPKGHGIYLNQKFQQKNLVVPGDSILNEFFKDRRHDKVERANNVVPHLGNRKIYINELLGNKEELLNQVLGFPKVKHDDFCDTLIDGLKMLYAREVSILDVL